jgi:hypothetical protein
MLRLLIYAALFFVFEGAFVYFGVAYTLSDLKNYTDALLASAGMVFTIMGIWIAFLYPNALKRIVDQETVRVVDFTETLSETKRLESIVASVLKSSIAIIFVLLIYLLKVIFSHSHFYTNNVLFFKATALALTTLVSVMQVESIISVVVANIMFINDLHRKREDRQMDAEI